MFPCGRLVKLAGALIALAVPTLFMGGCGGYNCPKDHTHCYGTVTFDATQNGTNGFATQVTAVPLHSGNGELNNEVWVVQYNNPSCGNYSQRCWIEVGLSAGAYGLPSNETHVFWADNRPNHGFYFHDQGALQAQEFNQAVFLLIRPHFLEASAFDVDALTCADVSSNATCAQRWIIGKSTNNAMVASRIVMGMELSGTNGASAANANFAGSVVLNPNASYLSSDGIITMNAPVNAGWMAPPSTSNSGGLFFTSCCQ